MIIHYLKAVDEAALWQALETAGLASKQYDPNDPLNVPGEDQADDWQPTGAFTWVKADGYDLDIIGTIYEPAVESEPVPLEGYHANIRRWFGDFSPEQLADLPTIASPSNPVRKWAGD